MRPTSQDKAGPQDAPEFHCDPGLLETRGLRKVTLANDPDADFTEGYSPLFSEVIFLSSVS